MAGATNAQPAVIDTSPAMAPLSAKVGSGLRNQIQAVNSAPTAPAAAATLVLSAIRAMLRSVPATVLPALKPNHPNQRMKTPQRRERQAVAGDGACGQPGAVLHVLADAGADDHGADQAQPAAGGMDDGGAGEVGEAGADVVQPAAAPGPVADDRIDQRGHEHAVDHVGGKAGPFGHGAGDDRRRGCGEHRLEQPEGEVGSIAGPGRGEVGQEEVAAAEQAGLAGPEHEGVADGPERQHADGEVHEVLHQDVGRVLGAGEARFEHREAGLHQEDQDGREQRPYRVDRQGIGVGVRERGERDPQAHEHQDTALGWVR